MGRQQNRQLLPLIGSTTMTGSAVPASRFLLVKGIPMLWNVLIYLSGVVCAWAVIQGLNHG